MSEEFDIDAGVESIANDLGFNDPDNEEIEENEDSLTTDIKEDDDGLQIEGQKTAKTEDVTTEETEDEKEQEQPVTAKAPPQSWAKDKHELWATLPVEAQDYYELREKQMLDGIEQYKSGYKYGEILSKTLDPFREEMAKNGVDEVQAINNLFGHHRALTSGSLEQRQEAFVRLGQSIGLIPPSEGQPAYDPRTQELQARLNRIEQQEAQRMQEIEQQHYQDIERQVTDFAMAPGHEYFNEVADDIAILLNSGIELQDAYDRAVWANPITRAKELAKQAEQQAQSILAKKKEEAEKAKKATSSNVRTIKTNSKSNEPMGSWEDTMRETLERLKNS